MNKNDNPQAPNLAHRCAVLHYPPEEPTYQHLFAAVCACGNRSFGWGSPEDAAEYAFVHLDKMLSGRVS